MSREEPPTETATVTNKTSPRDGIIPGSVHCTFVNDVDRKKLGEGSTEKPRRGKQGDKCKYAYFQPWQEGENLGMARTPGFPRFVGSSTSSVYTDSGVHRPKDRLNNRSDVEQGGGGSTKPGGDAVEGGQEVSEAFDQARGTWN
ncbi:hypothetical protein KM043_004418 [Ampulex compressa]|nr:hypothetical protein KM043_004418 [Ampulex compressa]